jgi:glutaminyl-peptide cyclotransferase
MRFARWILSGLLLITAVPVVAQEATPEVTPESTAEPAPTMTAILIPQVIDTFGHSADDFTQGLVWFEGRLFQSVGIYGESRLQELDPETGEAIREVPLDDVYFAEGLALVGDRLIQLTWQEQTAFVYDLETFELIDSYAYETEGWGLCYNGDSLYMSDGSASLFRRDPDTFELLEEIPVTIEGAPLTMLNELECVGNVVFANIWQTEFIALINAETGIVESLIDARTLLTSEQRAQLGSGSVLNGIAYIPERETLLLTGKRWTQMFETELLYVGESDVIQDSGG